ncbi:pseudouridine synthase [Siphonobacter aquaeclarae]|jgi:23S rRNA pseudouridine2605 synthase|uniref:Pseudouridine synthase n=1 Tax=Siphonobacter aquaeclarae TaxID=563176 RepID=A0A1G9VC19_9BACT|nr:pseudouridine synthase [Siphonobacter aquaeclarae]SDM69742.1 23S rRNA pseudouridine2605 synthase [Siphonobacter aquaeclarae]
MAKQEESPRRPRKTEGKPAGASGRGARSEGKPAEGGRFSEKRPARAPRREDDRPRGERPARGDFRSDRKPEGDRSFAGKNEFSRPFKGKPEGDRPPRKEFGSKPFKGKSEGDRPPRKEFGNKPFKGKSEGDRPARKEFGSRPFKGKPEGDRPFSDKKEFSKPFREKPEGSRSFGGKREFPKTGERREEGDRPARKPRSEAPASFGKRSDSDATRPKSRRGQGPSDERGPKRTPTYNLDKYKENAPDKIRRKIAKTEKQDDSLRLNRYIALSGVCSRRDADKLIEAGEISINGKVIKELGHQVKPGEVVRYGRRILNPEKMVYVLLNKPKDYITTVEDDLDRRTVMDLVREAADQRIYPVGRLDRSTTGLILLTNDGELAEKLTHPSNQIEKIYQVEIDKPVTTSDFEALRQGAELEDGFIKPDEVSIITPDAQVIGIRIHSGRNRIVRRLFEHFGYEVTKLDRTVFAGLNKKDLPRGQWRYLTEKEVIRLKYLV